jgi:nucleotide-binding universal stress UspA family protein
MTATQNLFVIAAIWASIGIVASIVMGRRGHSAYTWLLLGAVLGPIVIPLSIPAIRSERRDGRAAPRTLRTGVSAGGPVDVLVGIDGSDRADEALRVAVRLFGDHIGRLTLAGVIDYDSAITGRPWQTEDVATKRLDQAAGSVDGVDASTVLLAGQPAEALEKHAVERGYEVIVVGRRGHGATEALLGSTATRLAHGAGSPVVIV